MLIYVTGCAASGKTSVCEELVRRGDDAYDACTCGVDVYRNERTGEIVSKTPPSQVRTKKWRSEHKRVRLRNEVEKLVDRARNKTVFLCGTYGDKKYEAIDLFAQVFYLNIDDETMEYRVEHRTNGSGWGKNPGELDEA